MPTVLMLGSLGLIAGCGESRASTIRPPTATRAAVQTAVRMLGGVELRYLPHVGTSLVTSQSLERTTAIIRRRLRALAVDKFWVGATRHGSELVVLVADSSRSTIRQVEDQAGTTARLAVYDWESNVIGPSGQPAPKESTATGGWQAGAPLFGLSEYQAVLRAASRQSQRHPSETSAGAWFLLDSADERVLRGPAATESTLYADHYKAPAATQPRPVHINPGTVIVRAKPDQDAPAPNRWYVLNDSPAITGSDMTAVSRANPAAAIGLTARGQQELRRLTRELAQRSQNAQLPGVGAEATAQHLAVVLDNRLIATPAITASQGSLSPSSRHDLQLGEDVPPRTAQSVTEALRFGALPLELELTAASQTPALHPHPSQPRPLVHSELAFSQHGHTEHGDTVHVEGRFGSIQTPSESDVDQAALNSCRDVDGRELVRRLDLAVTITSSLPGDVQLGGFVVRVSEEDQHAHWLLDYVLNNAGTPRCYQDTSENGGIADLGTLQPHVPARLTVWVVLPNAITPNNPHPSARQLAQEEWLIGYPFVSVDGAVALPGGGELAATG